MDSIATHTSSSQSHDLHSASSQLTRRSFHDPTSTEASSTENLLQDTVERDDCKPLPEDFIATKRSGTVRRRRDKDGRRSRRPKTPGVWKKILWVKQSCKLIKPHSCLSLTMGSRSRQLYRSSNIPLPSTVESTSCSIRFLASCCRLNSHCPACLLGGHIHLLLCRHLSRARITYLSCQLGVELHISRLASVGHVDRAGRKVKGYG